MTTITRLTPNASQLHMMQEMNRMQDLANGVPVTAGEMRPGSEVSFHQIFSQALSRVDGLQQDAEMQQNAVEMGDSDDLVGAMIASQQAALSFSALVQVRNKVASGVNDLMNMSV
ncbi:flagellar hook-basal body complex protein FliE [Enterobacter sp. PGRG2]|uniref:flagellar hook-basal body complex protein FliE n=1 Tax=Enterobacter sp. PGRG2 TaxID=3104013 RepID=UPI0039F53171